MAHYDLEEQEQIDSLKTWWKMYGNLVTGLVMAFSIAVLAWQGWNWYQRQQAAQAAGVFAVLEQALSARDAQKVKMAAGELTEKYAASHYAAVGALLAAKLSFESNDLPTARAQLSWVAEHAKDEAQDIARLRLAAVLLDEKSFDEALKALDKPHAAAYDARFLDLKGDILTAQGKRADARAAYKAALDKLAEQGGVSGELLQQKMDGLGEGA